MKISVDVFAQMLGVKPGEIVWAVKDKNELMGLTLPRSSRSNPTKPLMFDLKEATAFAEKFHNSMPKGKLNHYMW
ncbi:hypothetical protein [Erwinia pyrifoliae]|uniref:hypothetical protein n=1 Tax=Erwinia pyrifoliae TaxID=79967 RepID=UPI00223B8467|nr:hypothetical protein [Erwinia pyrifoliae]MCT2388869.1 hypothetical protein [Erwinia pyrifoliae]MCU8589063.1 hypothetical protein [Erwinia pyrifoliae]